MPISDKHSLFSKLPVMDLSKLYGRENEMKMIIDNIQKYMNISIVGERYIGKTSLLKCVIDHLGNNHVFKHTIPIYFDLDNLALHLTVEDIISDFIEYIYESNGNLNERFANKSGTQKDRELRRIVQYCSNTNITILLFIDHFDNVTKLKNLTEDFFTYLRGIASGSGLGIITSSRNKLETLCHKSHISGSHFWNIFNPIIYLGLINKSDHLRELLKTRFDNDKLIECLINLIGRHPAFIKIASNYLISNGSVLDINEFEIHIDNIYDEVKSYYQKCINSLHTDESLVENNKLLQLNFSSVLNSLVNKQFIDEEKYKREIKLLIEMGYIVREGQSLNLYSPLFERYLKEHDITPISYSGDKPFVFISYCHEDKEQVLRDVKKLHRNNYRIWYDDGIEGGSEWRKILGDKIIASETFIVFISANSINSKYVLKEIEWAILQNKHIIPVYIEETEKHWIDFELSPKQAIRKYEDEIGYFNKLIEAINRVCKE